MTAFARSLYRLRQTSAVLAMGGLAVALLATVPAQAQDASKGAPAAAPAAAKPNPNTVIAKVNGAEIRQSDVDLAEEELGPQLAQMEPAARRENILTYLITTKLVAKVAEDKKLTDSPDFKRKLALTREKLLMDQVLASEGKAATTEAALRAVYDEATKQTADEVEVHARHVLVETEDEAKKIAEEAKKGGDFAELAKKNSKDPGGASDGGDLGFFVKDQMVPEFSAAAFKMEPGQISDPVKTQFGWHIIKVEEKRTRKPPAFEQVRGQVETFVTRKAQAEYIEKLRQAAKIERLDQAAATPAPAAPADKAAPAPAKKK